MNAFVQPGDFVITEAPEYPLILDMIEAHGAMAFGVPMDGFGMLPDALDRALTMLESQRLAVPHGGHQVSMILLQPRAQNPTGASSARNASTLWRTCCSRTTRMALVCR